MASADIFNSISRGASSIASMGLQAISGSAGVAKQATLAIGGVALTAMTIDSCVYLSDGLTSKYFTFNDCKIALPTLLNFITPINDYSLKNCENIEKISELLFQKQVLYIPVVFAGLALTYLAFKKIESGAAQLDKKLG